MPTYEVSLPDKMESKINRVVQEGDFLNREQAIEELLSRGISVYNTTASSSADDSYDDPFGDEFDEQHDPALRDDQGDEGPTF
ncbi:ribbon-helix-helix domain-containing protein [Salinibaculum rarum]|uniref:ribbon-helix-helix domain-containing protein n=1 Tax=Salinibaculum rarum TaxID=3058903 RepID=UPI00265DF038|nr:ribbon-helix-helix domain-containing protein [Salinibaculum sp. KK48]